MKKFLYILPLAALLLMPSCRDFFDDKQLDNGGYAPEDIRPGMTYTLSDDDYAAIAKHAANQAKALAMDDDSTAYRALLAIGTGKCFTEEASADMYAGAFLADKFPYLDNGTLCNLSYRLFEGKTKAVQQFAVASSYALSLNDYETIWNGHGALYLSPETEGAVADFLAGKFPTAQSGKIMVVKYAYLPTEPESIMPFLSYECSVSEILAAKETVEHQLHGIVGYFKPAVAKATGQFYLKDETSGDSILVYSMKHEDGSKVWESENLQLGDRIVLKGRYSEASGAPQITNAIFVSSTPAVAPAPRRASAAPQDTLYKYVIYQLGETGWALYQNDQLTAAVALPQSVYDALGSTTVGNPVTTVGTWLRATYPYAAADQVFLVAYNTATGFTADEWVYDGSDFVMTSGYVQEEMSFEVKGNQWIANISTYLKQAFVGEGLGKFFIQHVALDGLSYVWRYQAAYGATASAYVSSVNHRVEDWLISPTIRLKKSVQPQMSYMNAVRYGNTTDNPTWLSVMITNNFTGDVTTTEWKKLEFPAELPDGSNWTFLTSGIFDLSEYNGQAIVIAFRYKTDFDGIEVPSAPTWEIQNLLIAEPEEETAE